MSNAQTSISITIPPTRDVKSGDSSDLAQQIDLGA